MKHSRLSGSDFAAMRLSFSVCIDLVRPRGVLEGDPWPPQDHRQQRPIVEEENGARRQSRMELPVRLKVIGAQVTEPGTRYPIGHLFVLQLRGIVSVYFPILLGTDPELYHKFCVEKEETPGQKVVCEENEDDSNFTLDPVTFREMVGNDQPAAVRILFPMLSATHLEQAIQRLNGVRPRLLYDPLHRVPSHQKAFPF